MFTGIIEAQTRVIEAFSGNDSIHLRLERPDFFDDIKVGDSVACNGVCLTIESFDESSMDFTLGHETLQVTGWQLKDIKSTGFNVERSLKFGDRVHGHIVSGHVDGVSTLKDKMLAGESLLLTFELPFQQNQEIWPKSSIAINGVSLTVNKIDQQGFQVCLIPETLKKTNLESLNIGDPVNIETDYYLKGLLNAQREVHA